MIYFDSAATTLQKPPSVARAVAHSMNTMASLGRGGHRPGMKAAETAYRCRELASELFRVEDPDHVVLTFNATHGMNIAVHSLVKPGGTVLISGYEHNAVTRPLAAIPGVQIRVATADVFDRQGILDAFERELSCEKIDAVFCNHVSNVFGFILPVEEISELCFRRGIPFVVDASQSAGVLPVHMDELRAAFIVMPGHKGLYGPQGTGLLLCGTDDVTPVLSGGTGSVSELQDMPDFLPDRLEAGTHNVCGIAGLVEGLKFVLQTGVSRIAAHEWKLNRQMMDSLSRLPRVRVYKGTSETQCGVCSFVVDGMDSEEVGTKLAKQSVAVRTGLHCSPLAHRSAGTDGTGTVRMSFSVFNCPWEIERVYCLLKTLVK